jgi:hypothetical protein
MQQTSGILDVAIGLVFIYLLLSLICSALTESVEKWIFKYRGKKLSEGLLELFGGSEHSLAFLNDFYKNPLIYGLYKGNLDISRKNSGLTSSNDLPSYIPPKTFSLALVNHLLDGQPINLDALKNSLATASLPDNLKSSLQALVGTAGNDINQALGNIENWYSAMGDRVGGWYKRHTQLVAFVVAFGLTLIGNFDTLNIANSLMINSSLREQVVGAAGQASLCPPAADGSQCYQKQKQLLEGLGLPIGWKNPDYFPGLECPASDKAGWIWAWIEKIFGLFITAIAISLGAPFWFDILNKFMNVRATLKPQPEKRPSDEKTAGAG